MAISYRIDKENRLVTATALGDVSFQDFRAIMALMIEDPDFDPEFDRLWDMRLGHPTFSSGEVRSIAKVVGGLVGGHRAAIVAPGDVTYGLSRMLSVFLEDEGIDLRPFRTMEEAAGWLQTLAVPPFVQSAASAA